MRLFCATKHAGAIKDGWGVAGPVRTFSQRLLRESSLQEGKSLVMAIYGPECFWNHLYARGSTKMAPNLRLNPVETEAG